MALDELEEELEEEELDEEMEEDDEAGLLDVDLGLEEEEEEI